MLGEGEGRVTGESNPNGSARNIAGICNRDRNVLGMMPHPERACESALGSADGKVILESVVKMLTSGILGEPAEAPRGGSKDPPYKRLATPRRAGPGPRQSL